MLGLLRKIFGTTNDRVIKKLKKEIVNISHLEDYYVNFSDEALKKTTDEFKSQLQSGAKKLDDILYDAFAVVREASKRVMQKRHFDEQLIGGLILHRGMITEMRTGEGKTLTSTLPAYLNALTGKGVHIVTVNDYLAKRDSEWMGPLFNFLGLSVGYIVSGMYDEARKKAYQCDITYATNNELGFDYLRDNMKFSINAKAQRPFNYAIIDEVDSILVDEARTPLIISGPVNDKSNFYIVIDSLIKQIDGSHYERDEKMRSITLNEAGLLRIEELLVENNLIKKGDSVYDFQNTHLVHFINQALKANIMFRNNVEYLIQDGKLMIIDEFTGRVMQGRRYSDGLHQALEAKEGLAIQNENQTLASITFQNYFRLYPKLSGMTGTAMTESAEFKFIYNLEVVSVPPHRSVRRKDYDDEIYGSKAEKYDAILKLVKEANDKGQPVLVGTVSIEKSEEISQIFRQNNIEHQVLNAKYHEQEAHIISQAGRFKAVTIATNMAGRGTDIMLGGNLEMLMEEVKIENEEERLVEFERLQTQVAEEKEKVLQAGGLFVVGTERHESRRIDNQLRGRSGRQGDPGMTKFFLSLDDDLMRIFASEKTAGFLRSLGLKNGEAIQHPMISRALEKAQQKVEANNYEIRKNLLKFDDIINNQRKIVYSHRDDILSAQNILETVIESAKQWVDHTVKEFIPPNTFREEWQLNNLQKEVERVLNIKIDIADISQGEMVEEDIASFIKSASEKLFLDKQIALGEKLFSSAMQYVVLGLLDQGWKEHLYNLDHLRQGISLRAYGQKDPLNEYKKESFALFEQMLSSFTTNMVETVSHIHVDQEINVEEALKEKSAQQKVSETRLDPALTKYDNGPRIEAELQKSKAYVPVEERDPKDPNTWGRIARNDSCPCGSGKKYKQCHGAISS
jgi:preprotein translocase subunit SecA